MRASVNGVVLLSLFFLSMSFSLRASVVLASGSGSTALATTGGDGASSAAGGIKAGPDSDPGGGEPALPMVVDGFEEVSAWSAHPADGVELALSGDAGVRGRALRLDFRFTGGGYAVARREVSLDLPDNYAFRFFLRGEAPPNTFEFKLIDASGENVWWSVRRDLEFPAVWELFTIRSRQIEFAWGPAGGGEIRHVAAIEIAVTAGSGGEGTVWLDELELVPLPPRDLLPAVPIVRASSERESGSAARAVDGDASTAWEPAPDDAAPWIELDFGGMREYGGVVLDWLPGRHPPAYVIEVEAEAATGAGDFRRAIGAGSERNAAGEGSERNAAGEGSERDAADAGSAHDATGAPVLRRVEGNGGRDYLFLPESDSRTLRIRALSTAGDGIALAEVAIRPLEFAATRAAFFEAIASDAPRGLYPRGMSGEQPYWTVVGVDADPREGLIGEDGALEVERAGFSIEPFVFLGRAGHPGLLVADGRGSFPAAAGRLISWADVEAEQSLDRGFLPIPSVIWHFPAEDEGAALSLSVTAFGAGEPGASSIAVRYTLANAGDSPARATLCLALRPFQVNPPAQFLNQPGGTARIDELSFYKDRVRVNDRVEVHFLTTPDAFGAAAFDAGDIVADYLVSGRLPADLAVTDPFGAASGVLAYNLELPPGESREVELLIPLYPRTSTGLSTGLSTGSSTQLSTQASEQRFKRRQTLPTPLAPPGVKTPLASEERRVADGWAERLQIGTVEIHLPSDATHLLQSARAQIGWILVNRAGPAIQPGTRSYARSWIRDGALTSSALLRMGLPDPAREFLEWYAPHQYANGKIPCVVDARGADPVPEHDSSGEFIFLVAECHRFTGDRDLAERMWPRVVAAAAYLDSLRRERLTPEYQLPGMEHFYGILPPSISHEGYSAKPMHSYWDDFWAVRGFKDAVYLAQALGRTEEGDRLAAIEKEFAADLAASIEAAMRTHGIDFVPGSADLGDFDPTSTTIALSPAEAQSLLPEGAAERTFERYWEFFVSRRGGEPWEAFTPYEIRNAGAFVRLGWRDRAHELLDYFLEHQRPPSWRQWPEVVRSDSRKPGFLGDLPHTWVGSDYVRAFLDLFVYEREADDALVIAAGVPASWLIPQSEGGGVRVHGLPTRHGPLSYSLLRVGDEIEVRIDEGIVVPAGGIIVALPGRDSTRLPGAQSARPPDVVRSVPVVFRVGG